MQEDYFYSMVSPSKEIQDSLSVDEIFGFHAVDSRLQPLDWILSQQNLDSGFQSLAEVRISLSCIPDSKAQDSGFHGQKFPGHRIPLHIATMVRHKLKLELAGEISFLSFYSGVLSTLLLNLSFLV